MHEVEAIFRGLSKALRESRKSYHLTLGKLVDYLGEVGRTEDLSKIECRLDFNTERGPGQPSCYRGYYDDVAFNIAQTPLSARRSRATRAANTRWTARRRAGSPTTTVTAASSR